MLLTSIEYSIGNNATVIRYATEAIAFMNRATLIRDSLDCRNQRDHLEELATVYHLQEEQIARQEAEADARLYKVVIPLIALLLVLAITFSVYSYLKKRQIDEKNRVLARDIVEAIEYKNKYETLRQHIAPSETTTLRPDGPSSQEAEATLSDEDLYGMLRDVILREKLYLDPQLDRQALVERFGLSKERIGSAFAKGSPFKSLIEFLTDCRLTYATMMLTERPDLSIAEVAQQSGFPSMNTFGRNFKQKYALTPSQFHEQQG